MGKKEITGKIHGWIGKLNINKQWRKWLQSEINVIEIKNRTVGDILLNYKKWAQEDWFKIYRCMCTHKKEGRKEDEHEIWKLEDLEREMTQLTSKTVLTPNGRREKRIISKEIKLLKWRVEKLLGQRLLEDIKIDRVKYGSSELEEWLLKLKEKWKDWVVMERDKNTGAMAIACPMWY